MICSAWCVPCAAEPGHQTLSIQVLPDDGEIAGICWELATAIQHRHTVIIAKAAAKIPFMSERCRPSSWWNVMITLLDLLNLQQIIGYDCQSNNPEKKTDRFKTEIEQLHLKCQNCGLVSVPGVYDLSPPRPRGPQAKGERSWLQTWTLCSANQSSDMTAQIFNSAIRHPTFNGRNPSAYWF